MCPRKDEDGWVPRSRKLQEGGTIGVRIVVATPGTGRWDTKRQDERQFQQKPDTRGIKHSCQWEITLRTVASGWDRTSVAVFSGQGSVQTLGI